MKIHLVLALLLGSFPAAAVQAAETASSPPASVSASLADRAEQLARLVQSFVDGDELVGAELLILHEGRPVLHRAFGYADREAGRAMAVDSFFAIRSMTKPFTGMAALILSDEGRLEFDAPVARYLQSFDHPGSQAITVRQLLTHRAGFPRVMSLGKPLQAFDGGLRELADMAGATGPIHSPGSRFVYSDAGADVLGAVVSAVSGQPLDTFVRERILEPLRLLNTFPEAEAAADERGARVVARYVGMAGYWARYWSATDAPLYPFLKGSGGLLATASDYAQFLQAWMNRGEAGGTALLSTKTFARALTPSAGRPPVATGFPDASTDYGQMWTLYQAQSTSEIFAFGHSGSDGTHAYAFPKEKLIVCYFTQTRGHATTGRFEEALSHLFLKPDADAFARLIKPAEPKELRHYTGLYERNDRGSLAAVVELEGALMFEVPGRMLLRLRPTASPDRWVPERMPSDAVTFRREAGRVAGLVVTRAGNQEEARRFVPDASLPTTDELMGMRARSATPGGLGAVLPLRIASVVEQDGTRYPMTEVFLADGASYWEIDFGAAGKMRMWVEGERAWRQLPGGPRLELRGLERSEAIADRLSVACGDWRETFGEVAILAREKFQGREVLRVRTSPREGIASTRLVDAENGVVLAEYWLSLVPGAGLQPMERRYAEWREVEGSGGLRLPYAQTVILGGRRMQVSVSRVEIRAAIDPASPVR